MVVRVRVDDDGFGRRLAQFESRFSQEIEKAYARGGARWLRDTQNDIRSSPRTPPGSPRPRGAPPQVRTGELRRKLFFETRRGQGLGAQGLVVGGRARHTRIQELGGTVRPKRSRYLTVPLPAAYGQGSTAPPARTFEDAFFIRSRAGNLLLVRRRPGGGIEPLFVLKSEVRLQPRLTLRARARELAETGLRREFVTAFDRTVRSLFS